MYKRIQLLLLKYRIVSRLYILSYLTMFAGIILTLPHCVYAPLTNESSSQKLIDRAYRLVRTTYAYDQLTTTGFFDVLWLNDLVLDSFERLHYKQTHAAADCACGHLVATPSTSSFIVLGSYERQLFSPYCGWLLFLTVDGCEYGNPVVRGVDLPCEYRLFFGNYYNQFKTAYQVQFDVPFVTLQHARKVCLIFRSSLQEMNVCWKQKIKKGLPDEHCNRCRS